MSATVVPFHNPVPHRNCEVRTGHCGDHEVLFLQTNACANSRTRTTVSESKTIDHRNVPWGNVDPLSKACCHGLFLACALAASLLADRRAALPEVLSRRSRCSAFLLGAAINTRCLRIQSHRHDGSGEDNREETRAAIQVLDAHWIRGCD